MTQTLKSLADRLHFAAPPSRSVKIGVSETIADIDRILALPKRPPVDCERDPLTKRFRPETQALIEVMTAKFTRGPRLSCACRARRVTMEPDGNLLVTRVVPEDEPPPPPLRTSREALYADMDFQHPFDRQLREMLAPLAPGQTIELPSADTIGHACIHTLNPVQSWLLREAAMIGGAVGFCGVGSGKSIAFLLGPLLFPGRRLAVLCIEPKQRQHYHSQYMRLREHFRVPSVQFDDGRPGYVVPGTTPLRLISYSVLSRTQSSDLLDACDPDILELDEAHRCCGQSAINRRIKRFVAHKIRQREEKMSRGEAVPPRALHLLDASGTLEAKSIEDTQMLCAYSLGTGSPLPVDPAEAEKWSGVIDPSYQPDRKSRTAKMLQRVFGDGEIDDDATLLTLLGTAPESAIRRGFRARRIATPGIISAAASSINASIYLAERKPPKMPEAVHDALMKVRIDSLRPDGELLVEKIEQISTARHVALGFYTYWAFPKHPCTCAMSAGVRCAQCCLIDEWYQKRKEYNKELRQKLIFGEVKLDSPQLCWEAAERAYESDEQPLDAYCHTCLANDIRFNRVRDNAAYTWPCPEPAKHVPAWASLSWSAWQEIEHRVQYEEREKWIEGGGDYIVQDAARWAVDEVKGRGHGVVWFQSIAFGRALAQLTGLPYYNGGPGAEQRLRAEKGDRSIICSIKAHGAGTDGLQNVFHNQLIAETPASNATQQGYEQLLGRLHREGQRKDEVNTWGYFHVRELKDALRKAIEQAEFNYELTGNKQKLLMADIDVDGV